MNIIANVKAAWTDVPHTTLLNNFKTLQYVIIEILKDNGGKDSRFRMWARPS